MPEELIQSKPFWKSKTFWFNTLSIANTVAPAMGIPSIPMTAENTMLVMATGNLVLRAVTKGKVTLIQE